MSESMKYNPVKPFPKGIRKVILKDIKTLQPKESGKPGQRIYKFQSIHGDEYDGKITSCFVSLDPQWDGIHASIMEAAYNGELVDGQEITTDDLLSSPIPFMVMFDINEWEGRISNTVKSVMKGDGDISGFDPSNNPDPNNIFENE